MPIYKGTLNTESAYKGGTALDRIYKGSSLVFESGVRYEQSGTLPLMTTHPTKGKNLLNYQIYGNSIQDGTPTPSTPVEIVSVGETSINKFDKNNYTYLDAYISGGAEVNTSNADTTIIFKVSPSTTYTISASVNATNNNRLAEFTSLPTIGSVGARLQVISSVPYKFTVTTQATTQYIAFHYGRAYGTADFNAWINSLQIELGSTANPYEDFTYIIPSNYRKVTYIGATGTQYINTNFIPEIGDEFDIEYAYTSTEHSLMTLCSAGAGTYQTVLLGYPDEGFFFYKYFATGGAVQVRYPDPAIDEFQSLNIKSDGKIYVNGSYIGQSSPTGELDGSKKTLYLMTRRGDTSSSLVGNIKKFAIKRDSTLVLNLIPCYRKSDNVIGMYDTVSGTFFTNAGTGVFSKGSDVNDYKIPVSVQGINLLGDHNRSTLVTGSGSYGGLNFEYHDEDKTFDIWGTNTTANKLTFILSDDNGFAENTQCRLTGCIGGSLSTYYFQSANGYRDTGSGVNLNYKNDINRISLMVESGAVIERVTLKPMLTLGYNTEYEFEPYIEPVTSNIYLPEPLRKLGNYADYVDFENQKVYRRIAQSVIDNNSTFGKFPAVTNYSAFYMTKNDLVDYETGMAINQVVLSPQFLYHESGGGSVNSNWTRDYEITSAIASSYKRILFSLPNTIVDVESAKDWLEENPVPYYYPAKDIVEESITVPALSTKNKQRTVYRISTTTSPSRMDIVYKGSR